MNVEGPGTNLILLDIEMPVLDGPSMVRRFAAFQEREETMPIVLVSASGHSALEAPAARLGTRCFLRKSFGPQALVDIVTAARQSRPVSSRTETIRTLGGR